MRRGLTTTALLSLALPLTACEPPRDTSLPPPAASIADARQPSLQAGPGLREISVTNPFDRDPHAIAEGERLFGWYNCGGCHGGYGGGGIGPPLVNGERNPARDYDFIYAGRDQGMPSFGGRIPEEQIWKIIAYIQALTREEIQIPRVPSGPAPEEGSYLARGAP